MYTCAEGNKYIPEEQKLTHIFQIFTQNKHRRNPFIPYAAQLQQPANSGLILGSILGVNVITCI